MSFVRQKVFEKETVTWLAYSSVGVEWFVGDDYLGDIEAPTHTLPRCVLGGSIFRGWSDYIARRAHRAHLIFHQTSTIVKTVRSTKKIYYTRYDTMIT